MGGRPLLARSIEAGPQCTCAVTLHGGDVVCWGSLVFPLEDGVPVLEAPPTLLPRGMTGQRAVNVWLPLDRATVCVRYDDASFSCWGGSSSTSDLLRPLAYPSIYPITPVPRYYPQFDSLPSRVVAVAGGHGHACVLRATGSVRCHGLNDHRQLGIYHRADIPDPQDARVDVRLEGNLKPAMGVAVGDGFTCLLQEGGQVACWGRSFTDPPDGKWGR